MMLFPTIRLRSYLLRTATTYIQSYGISSGTSRASNTVKLLKYNASSTTTSIDAARPLKHLPMSALLRTILLSRIFASPSITRLGMSVLNTIASSRHPLLDPDRNWLLNRALRSLIYNHFCAGTGPQEIAATVNNLRSAGYAGVILTYAREIVQHELAEADPGVDISAQHIQQWLDGNMKTLAVMGRDDYLGVKFTGAGGKVASALKAEQDPPNQFAEALRTLCSEAQARGSRILVDAEQQIYQSTIDRWTVDLMRRYNRNGNALILNTYQAYLKSARETVLKHLELAREEGWTLGIKLVRGAYILNDIRERIHDTKPETDISYNGIVRGLLTRNFDTVTEPEFPKVRLFIAGHNAESIRQAAELYKQRVLRGLYTGQIEFGQLYGMADHVSGELLTQIAILKQQCENLPDEEAALLRKTVPHVFKCIQWGTVRECIHFLMRRAAENQGAVERLQDGLKISKKELTARIFNSSN
jgi:proline dehydrogenase